MKFVGFQIRTSGADSIVFASWTFIAVRNNFMFALKPVASSAFVQCRIAWFDQRLTLMSATWPDHSFVSTHDRKGLISWTIKNKLQAHKYRRS